jgi:4-amino-4-deoxychorismate lyase
MSIVFLDNDFLQEEEAKLPITDRGVIYGDGIYTTLLVEEGTIYFLEDHLKRLQKQCAFNKIRPPHIDREAVFLLLAKNHAEKGTFRLKIYITGGSSTEMALPLRESGHVFMTIESFSPPPYRPLDLSLFSIPVMAPHAAFKSLSCLHRFYVADFASSKGVDDAVTLTESGLLLEASFANLFWVYQDTLYTPDPSLPLYYGVTIDKVATIAREVNLKVEFVKKRLSDIPEGASFYRTNSLRGIRPIGSIEERTFPRSLNLEKALLNAYEGIKKRQGSSISLPVS